jgi:hypothetical protein
MKIAIMQPYIFPYLGYFQLIASVDKFIIYDDVNFIKQGWINRNNILLNGDRHLFSIPVENLTSYKKINDTRIPSRLYDNWLGKFGKTLSAAYKKAPFFPTVHPLVTEVLEKGRTSENISALCNLGIRMVCGYLGMDTDIADSSAVYGNDHLHSYERVIDICKKESADTYINAIGGRELYSKEIFRAQGLDLFFLESPAVTYRQFDQPFVPFLSIIDTLMFNSKDDISQYIKSFNLV